MVIALRGINVAPRVAVKLRPYSWASNIVKVPPGLQMVHGANDGKKKLQSNLANVVNGYDICPTVNLNSA